MAEISYTKNASVTNNKRNTALKEVLNEIEKQTDYLFIYNNKVNPNEKVSVRTKKKAVSEVLNSLLKEKDIDYSIEGNNIILSPRKESGKISETAIALQQREITITGIVTDESGEPVIGASIIEKNNPSHGTVTDIDGKFTMTNLPENTILQFTYVGMKPQEVAIEGKTIIYITMEPDIESLEEIVVVGYGKQKRSSLTGSVVQVNGAELIKVPHPNISQSLIGKLPGIIFKQSSGQPGLDDATMLVRGYGTYNNSTPLFLVDGVKRAFSHIDPNDIESVSVLKDASAAAVYGVEGAHGVILITTKRGKSGRPTLTYNGSVSVSQNTRYPEFLTGTEYAYWHNKANEMDGNAKWFSDEEIAMMSNGDPADGLENTDWVNKFLGQSAPTTQHNISINGGTENARYFTSLGMTNQNGFVKNMSFKTYNIRTNLDITLNKSWTMAMNIAGRMEKSNTPGSLSFEKQATWNPIAQAYNMLPFVPFKYNGLPASSTSMTFNPFGAVELTGFQKGLNAIIETSAEISYSPNIIKGLKISLSGSYDRRYGDYKTFAKPYLTYAYEPQLGKYSKKIITGFLEHGNLNQTSGNSEYMIIRPSMEYIKDFNKHHFEGLFLYELQKGYSNEMNAARWGFILTDLPELSFGQTMPPIPNSGKSNESSQAGFVGRLNYSYASKYLLEMAFREDASYKFPEHSRWGFFPSASVGWLLSEENFFKALNTNIDKLKIRMSAGTLGRDNVGEFLFKQAFALSGQPVVAFGNPLLTQYALSSTTSFPSVNLTWEKTNIYNLGVELSMWNGLLTTEIDGFYKYTYDILQNVGGTYPSSLGGNFPSIENTGSVDVRGFELQLAHRNKIRDFEYSISGNFSYAKNRILSLTETENIEPWQSMIGKSIGQKLAYVATGLIQTEDDLANTPWFTTGDIKRLGDIMYKDLNGDGKIDFSDMKVATRPEMPDLMYALNVDLKYKNFDFSMMWQGSALNDVLLTGYYDNGIPDATIFTKPFYGLGYNTARYILEDSWTPEHSDARYARLSLVSGRNNVNSTWWIEDGAYLRLKDATFGYNVPQTLLNKSKIEGLRIYVAGSNLLTFSGLKYLDPEMPSVNNGYYPQQRTYSCGLSLTF
jgi:TonB-linked SusC/RagA family outer membrane protein